MIFDHISHYMRYVGLTGVFETLQYLASLPGASLPAESVALPGGVAVNPVSLMTKPENECLFEAHNQYIDVHFTLSGTERIDVQDRALLSKVEEHFPARDIGFYDGEAAASCLVRPGWFLVCFPDDAHRVAVAAPAPGQVEKLVGKVPV